MTTSPPDIAFTHTMPVEYSFLSMDFTLDGTSLYALVLDRSTSTWKVIQISIGTGITEEITQLSNSITAIQMWRGFLDQQTLTYSMLDFHGDPGNLFQNKKLEFYSLTVPQTIFASESLPETQMELAIQWSEPIGCDGAPLGTLQYDVCGVRCCEHTELIIHETLH